MSLNKNAPSRPWQQLKLSTILYSLVVIAACIAVWMRVVAPAVSGVSFRDGRVIIHLAELTGSEMLPDALADDHNFSPYLDSGDVFVHDAYVSFSWGTIVIGAIAIVAVLLGVYFGVRIIGARRVDSV